MEKVSVKVPNAAGVMQMHRKLTVTKFLPGFLPDSNCQGKVKKYQSIEKKKQNFKRFLTTVKIRCTVYCKILCSFLFSACFHIASFVHV